MSVSKKCRSKPTKKTRFGKATFHQLKIYQLCYFKGLSFREIAKECNIQKRSVHSALKTLKKHYPKLFPIYKEMQFHPICKTKVKYRGVVYHPVIGGFDCEARISKAVNGKQRYVSLGHFKTPEQAAKAYDKEAKKLWGDKAILNFNFLKETSAYHLKCYRLCSMGFTQRQTGEILNTSEISVYLALKYLKKRHPNLFSICKPKRNDREPAKTDNQIGKELWGEKTVLQFGNPNNISLFQLRCYQLCSGDFYGLTQTKAAEILGIKYHRVNSALKKLEKTHPIFFPLRNRKLKKVPFFYENRNSEDQFNCDQIFRVVREF